MAIQPQWKQALRAEAEEFLRSQPTELVWVPCTFCHEDTLVEHPVFAIEYCKAGRGVLGATCDDCKASLTPA
jgi:hypothetical protein